MVIFRRKGREEERAKEEDKILTNQGFLRAVRTRWARSGNTVADLGR